MVEQVWNHEKICLRQEKFELMSNHCARSEGIIGISFAFSLTSRYVVCSH